MGGCKYILHVFAVGFALSLTSVPVEADSNTAAAQEKYVLYLSRDDMTPSQNEVLAECMIERLSTMGKKILLLANSERDAEIAMLAAGHNPADDDCLAKAMAETP